MRLALDKPESGRAETHAMRLYTTG